MSDHLVGLIDRVMGRAHSAAGRLRVRSALNPMLWLCALISLPCLAGAWLARGVEPIATVLTFTGVAPVAVTCLQSMYFAVCRPDKLQSEDYQLKHETLELIKEKGSKIDVSPSSLEIIANPIRGELPTGGDAQ
jgi:hypothetical protein